jgi:hypothetical protein
MNRQSICWWSPWRALFDITASKAATTHDHDFATVEEFRMIPHEYRDIMKEEAHTVFTAVADFDSLSIY